MGLLTGYRGRPCCSKVLLLWFNLFPSSCTLYIYQRFYSAHNLPNGLQVTCTLHFAGKIITFFRAIIFVWMFIFPVFTGLTFVNEQEIPIAFPRIAHMDSENEQPSDVDSSDDKESTNESEEENDDSNGKEEPNYSNLRWSSEIRAP